MFVFNVKSTNKKAVMPHPSVAIVDKGVQPNLKVVAPVVVYTKKGCPWCVKAKAKLRKHKIPFKEISAGGTLPDGRTSYSVPQIFLPVGGFDAMGTWLPLQS